MACLERIIKRTDPQGYTEYTDTDYTYTVIYHRETLVRTYIEFALRDICPIH